jgi:hypothetical protein
MLYETFDYYDNTYCLSHITHSTSHYFFFRAMTMATLMTISFTPKGL